MTQEEKDVIKDMNENSAGWKVFSKWIANEREGAVSMLIYEDNDENRGKIHFIDLLLNEFKLYAKDTNQERSRHCRRTSGSLWQ